MPAFHSMSSFQAAQTYHRLGFDTFPLPSNGKTPALRGWPQKSPDELWKKAATGCNIAIRCGGKHNLCVIDCDDRNAPGTAEKIVEYLKTIGLNTGSYPMVSSASGIGRHLYLLLTDPEKGHLRHINPEFGAGEVRYGHGSYVVAPPSTVGGNQYRLVSGDFGTIPEISWADLVPLMLIKAGQKKRSQVSGEDTNEPRSSAIPSKIVQLFSNIQQSEYRSGSEMDSALLVTWCNIQRNIKFKDVLRAFVIRAEKGRFFDLYKKSPDQAEAYLKLSFEKAVEFSDFESEARTELRELIQRVENEYWPTVKNLRNKAVYLAHLSIAVSAGTHEYTASIRQLAEVSGQTEPMVTKANRELIRSGKLEIIRNSCAIFSHQYRICIRSNTLTHSTNIVNVLSETHSDQAMDQKRYNDLIHHDLFSPRGLNIAGLEIAWHLRNSPMRIGKLVKATGLGRSTVHRVLRKMARILDTRTGEIFALVRVENKIWSWSPDISLDDAAIHLGVWGRRERMIIRHTGERNAFRKQARKIQKGKNSLPDIREAVYPSI